jgi:hypothetical protein
MSRPALPAVSAAWFVLAAAGCAGAQARAPAPPEIPARFHGQWNSDLARCGDWESGTNIVIEARGIAYFEAGDIILAVRPAELDGVNIDVQYEEFEGTQRLSRTLILSDDRQTLSFTYGDGPEDVFRRCPQTADPGQD